MDRIETIAKMAHAVNSAYCEAIGDPVAPPWEQASEDLRDSICTGVIFHLENPSATAQDSHDRWLETKADQGWTFGEVKSEANKTHPNIVPYEDLPQEQRVKDHLFRAVVHAANEALNAGGAD